MLIQCPHCQQLLMIIELNCGIFRCGVYKHNFNPIPPHLDKVSCDMLINNNLIYGCSKPFKIIGESAFPCDYI